MNVYDALTQLTDAIKQSPEYTNYKNSAEEIDSNAAHSKMMKDFMAVQIELSTLQMLGQQPNDEQIERFNTMYATIANISAANEFIQSQMAFSRIIEDVSKEIAKVAKLDVEFLNIVPNTEE